MVDFFRMFISRSWEFFCIRWPGFGFTVGQAFLAVFASLAAARVVMRMSGVSLSGSVSGAVKAYRSSGGNNSSIKVSKERQGDTK